MDPNPKQGDAFCFAVWMEACLFLAFWAGGGLFLLFGQVVGSGGRDAGRVFLVGAVECVFALWAGTGVHLLAGMPTFNYLFNSVYYSSITC